MSFTNRKRKYVEEKMTAKLKHKPTSIATVRYHLLPVASLLTPLIFHYPLPLTLSLTGVGPFGPSLPYMQITLNVLKVRYRQKIGIPQAGSYACFELATAPILDLISL